MLWVLYKRHDHMKILFNKVDKSIGMLRVKKIAQTKPLFVNHHILTVSNINIFQVYCFMYKVRYNLLPLFCHNWFKKKQ